MTPLLQHRRKIICLRYKITCLQRLHSMKRARDHLLRSVHLKEDTITFCKSLEQHISTVTAPTWNCALHSVCCGITRGLSTHSTSSAHQRAPPELQAAHAAILGTINRFTLQEQCCFPLRDSFTSGDLQPMCASMLNL